MAWFGIEDVRRLAQRWGWHEVHFNETSRVLGFMRQDERVNVYYTTGTVGTCVNHPRQGRTQLFRRDRSLSTLGQIFHDPRVHTGDGYYRRVSAGRPEPSHGGGSGLMVMLNSEHDQDVLLGGWDSSCMLALGAGYMVVSQFGDTWWSAVPKALDNKLRGRQRELPPVDYVALGPDNSYFVQFVDGKAQWSHWNEYLTEALQSDAKAGLNVELLAFAPDGGYYVLWEDCTSQWMGLPTGLDNQLKGRGWRRPGVEFLSVGPEGEWFVRYQDGSWRANNLSTSCSEALDETQEQGCKVLQVLFGEDWTWAIRYGY